MNNEDRIMELNTSDRLRLFNTEKGYYMVTGGFLKVRSKRPSEGYAEITAEVKNIAFVSLCKQLQSIFHRLSKLGVTKDNLNELGYTPHTFKLLLRVVGISL